MGYYIISLIASFFSLILYSSISGKKDALIYGRKGADSFPGNEHLIYVKERGCICLLLISVSMMVLKGMEIAHNYKELEQNVIASTLILIITWVMNFSFFHNGSYGLTMERMGFKGYGFTYTNHGTGTNDIELSFGVRTFFACLSFLVFISYIIFIIW